MRGLWNRELGTGGRVSSRAARRMKPSGIPWLGDVPEGWEICRVGYLMNEINRRSVDGEEEPLSMSQKLGIVPSREIEVANPASSYVGAKIVEPGDLVLNKLKAHLGVFAISKYNGVVSPDYSVYRVNEGVSAKYLNYLFHTPVCISEFRRRITGVAVGFNRLYTSEFFKIQIPLPPLAEQRAIAGRIDSGAARIDALREKIKCEIDRLGDYKKSLIAETVSKGLHKRKLKPSGIPWLGSVPENWEIVRNKAFMRLTNEKVGPRKTEFPLLSLSKQGVIFRDVSEGKGKFPKDFDTYLVVRPGNLVFCLFDVAETPRTVGLVKNVGMLSGAYTNFEIDSTMVEPKFAYYYYISVDDMKRLEPYYTGLRKIVKTDTFLSLKFPLPPLPEQREIAEYLDRAVSRIDAVVARRKVQLEKLESFKRSFITEAVTGRIAVATGSFGVSEIDSKGSTTPRLPATKAIKQEAK